MNTQLYKFTSVLSLVIAFMTISLQADAQVRYFDERYISSHAFVNPVIINPGAIGQSGYHTLLANYRDKWASFPGAPKSFIVSYDGSVGNNLGVGAMFVSDKAGYLSTTKGQLGFSYTLMSESNKLGLGVTAEYISHGVDAAAISDPTVDPDDVILSGRLDNRNFFDLSLGVHGVYADKLLYSVTLPGLVDAMLDDSDDSAAENEFGYIVQLGYQFKSVEYDVTLVPSIMVKQLRYVPTHVDINVLAKFLEEKLTGGLTYTIGADEKLGFLIGARVNAFNFFYSYGVSRHDFQDYNNGSHELSVRFDIGRTDKMSMNK